MLGPQGCPQSSWCAGGNEACVLGDPPHNGNKQGCQGNVAFLWSRTQMG